MNILYFGTVCETKRYEQILKTCKHRPTVATVVFETALLEGLFKNEAEVEVHSFPMIPTFPKSKLLRFGGDTERLPCGYNCRWLKTWNIPFLKQWSRRADARRVLKRWCKDHAGEGVLLSYSIPPFMSGEMVRLGKKYQIKTVAIVPDLPANMYQNHKGNPLIDAIKHLYLRGALQNQGRFDGYVYLTEAMAEVVAPRKPYMVMEGILNCSEGCHQEPVSAKKRAIMYAGRLHEKYGVMALVDAFERLELKDVELWLFGDGSAVADIQDRASRDQRIRYFGRVSREEILQKEKEAALLVNPRGVKDTYTRYSFPSKTIEYMASGTPLLTTRLEGIPKEYFDYVFSVDDNNVIEIKEALESILSMSEEELSSKGERAREFVMEHKNAKSQAARIIDFLQKLVGGNHSVDDKERI